MKRLLFILFHLLAAPGLSAQEPKALGGDALEALSQANGGRHATYATEYMRMYAMYVGEGKFGDYFADGKRYTVFIPDDLAFEVYYAANGGPNGNTMRLCNTMKYSIAKGFYRPDQLKDGQKLYTLFPSHPLTVKRKKEKIFICDLQGNSVKVGTCFEVGNIIFYPVKTCLRY